MVKFSHNGCKYVRYFQLKIKIYIHRCIKDGVKKSKLS